MLSFAQRRLEKLSPCAEPPEGQTLWVHRGLAPRPETIRELLETSGWLLLRGVEPTTEAFGRQLAALNSVALTGYPELPRRATSIDVDEPALYEVTPFAAEEAILFHHEGAHTEWTIDTLAFACLRPADEGGETPLVDGVHLWQALPSRMRQAFTEVGLLYVRRFSPGIDVDWRQFLDCTEPAEALARCAARGWEAAFDHDEVLHVTYQRPAYANLGDGAISFFNQILLHHPACLDPEVREGLEVALGATPRDVRFGDGRAIPDDWIATVVDLAQTLATRFAWQAGDVLIVDNRRFAHARTPYRGDRRHCAWLGRLFAGPSRVPKMGGTQ
ncbi:TauD/TfdA family dioxygenase [Thauera sp. Sel9]|uniref:TauD/TfdA family dioxygenase n=1 Tax=Thauera sp. Sel9 TaxID=2974299 RepID=UPI0021E17794|nr:TauD/TfdA family dioxygenase [Thauera sp. Sel9]MCV2218524.1 TauD/TfdA family dioxygenase [Thauera sp. Sel9]